MCQNEAPRTTKCCRGSVVSVSGTKLSRVTRVARLEPLPAEADAACQKLVFANFCFFFSFSFDERRVAVFLPRLPDNALDRV